MDWEKINMGPKIAFKSKEEKKISDLVKKRSEAQLTGKMTGGMKPIITQ